MMRNIYSSSNPVPRNTLLNKYWKQRYLIWKKFDEGIQVDEEGLFSAIHYNNVETISELIRIKYGFNRIVDACCGVGGSAINFSLLNPRSEIIGIELDETRSDLLKHNLNVYNITNVNVITGDVMNVLPTLRGIDAVFCSPPWGGIRHKGLTLDTIGINLFEFANAVRYACGGKFNCALHLPRDFPISEVKKLSTTSRLYWYDLRRIKTSLISARLFIFTEIED